VYLVLYRYHMLMVSQLEKHDQAMLHFPCT
jgi:hypothetical protein